MEWISIEHRKPNNNKYVLVAIFNELYADNSKSFYVIKIARRFNDAWADGLTGDILPDYCSITHWMPLPDPPNKED